eukprot:scaffold95313_cov81-Phaeocystis_antarctica.AAC.3
MAADGYINEPERCAAMLHAHVRHTTPRTLTFDNRTKSAARRVSPRVGRRAIGDARDGAAPVPRTRLGTIGRWSVEPREGDERHGALLARCGAASLRRRLGGVRVPAQLLLHRLATVGRRGGRHSHVAWRVAELTHAPQHARRLRRLRRVEVPPLEAIRPARLPRRRTRRARQRLLEEALVLRLRHRGGRGGARRAQEVDAVRLEVVHSAGRLSARLLVGDRRAEQSLQRLAVAVRQPRIIDAREPLAIEVLQSRG